MLQNVRDFCIYILIQGNFSLSVVGFQPYQDDTFWSGYPYWHRENFKISLDSTLISKYGLLFFNRDAFYRQKSTQNYLFIICSKYKWTSTSFELKSQAIQVLLFGDKQNGVSGKPE